MALLVVTASCAVPGEALAVPARRLLRRGVIVAAPSETQSAGTQSAGTQSVAPAPIVVGPALRPRRRLLLQPVAPVTPAAPNVAARQPAPAKAPTPAKASPAATAAVKSGKIAPKQVPAQQPKPAGEPTVAGAVAAPSTTKTAESMAFTPDWYARHPQAWRPTQASTDWWQAASVATITAWLGQPVTAAGTAASDAAAVTTAGAVVDDGLQSVLVLPAGHDNQAAPAASDADWLPLGVFAVAPQGSSQSHVYQQLAVNRKGGIKGTSYDAISGTSQPIEGTIDRTSSTASWTVGTNGSRFTAPIRAFTSEPRTVSVVSAGQSRSLELMPMQRP